ncbi:hypothetical protein CRYUN_Cryun38cG0048400 [Craigia yunnanensis]
MSLPGFFIICMLHSIVAITFGALMMFYTKEVSVFGHGHEIANGEFQSFFAKGCVLLHVLMVIWRVSFEGKLDDLAHEWPRQALGDIALALSWVFLLVYSWRQMYD